MGFAVLVFSHLIARCGDQGLANACGLATLRHGTNPLSWLSIHLTGANPKMGGSSIGGDFGSGFHQQNVGRFYFATDEGRFGQNLFFRAFKARMLPRGYICRSTELLMGRIYIPTIFSQAIAGNVALWMPTIKFRFSQHQVSQMKPDKSIPGYARSVNYAVSALNIGIIGTIKEAFTFETFTRINENRVRFITGIAQLSLCAVAAYFLIINCSALIVAHKVSFVAGSVLGVM